MKNLICALVATAASLAFAGDDAERVQLAREMIRVSSPSNTVAEMQNELYAAMPRLRHFQNSCDRFITKQTPVLIDACAQGFARHLSVSEIRELTAIFQHPVMQKYFGIQEEAKAEALAIFQKHLEANPEIHDQLVEDMMKEQEQRRGAQQPPARDK